MSSGEAEYTSYLEAVIAKVKEATDKALFQLGFQIVARAQTQIQGNGQIDTGFMLNSGYVASRDASTYAGAGAQAGAAADRVLAPEQRPGQDDVRAVVVFGANYSIYQENKASFLFAGAERAVADAGGTLEAVYREVVND